MLEGKYPCWCCGKHYITVTPRSDTGYVATCPECGELDSFYPYENLPKKETILELKERIHSKLKYVPTDPEQRKIYFEKAQREKQCWNNMGRGLWGDDYDGLGCTSYYAGNTLYFWHDCFNEYLTVGEAQVLLDKLNKWLGGPRKCCANCKHMLHWVNNNSDVYEMQGA